MKKYISRETIESAVNKFKGINFSKGNHLGLFFYFKAVGLNNDCFVTYEKSGQAGAAENSRRLRLLYDLSGLFDVKLESGSKFCALFPFSFANPIKANSFYNGASPFKTLISRVSDTLDNSLIDSFVEKSGTTSNQFRFKADYVSFIQEKYLKSGLHIPLGSLVAWYFRNWEIEVDGSISDEQITVALVYHFLRNFNITSDEFRQLFSFDIQTMSLSDVQVNGQDLRAMLSISDPQCQPSISPFDDSNNIPLTMTLTLESIKSALSVVGNFLDENGIARVLKQNEEMNREQAKLASLTETEKEIVKRYKEGQFSEADISNQYQHFQNQFGREAISKLSGEALLYKLFGKKKDGSLAYTLENGTGYFGGISGYRWLLYLYEKDGQWIFATNKHGASLTKDQAIAKATEYRDRFVRFFEFIESSINSNSLETPEGYSEVEKQAKDILGDNLYKRQWFRKYLHLLYPKYFINVFSSKWISKIFRVANLVPEKSYYLCCWQFLKLSEKLEVPNVFLYHILESLDDSENDDDDSESEPQIEYRVSEEQERNLESQRLRTGINILLYGVPGCGKSYTIKKEYCQDETKMERVVFHPDYTYSDFVGQILPVLTANDSSEGESKIIYKFVPGPFTQILKKAFWNPQFNYFLIIEEINRGNAPAIFGDIFQLLDRSSDVKNFGESEYGITNSDIAEEVYGVSQHKVRIPSNLSIICTMNTSDQNVFTLDTAFQRRWNMRLVENKFGPDDQDFANTKILDTSVSWKKFSEKINAIILGRNSRLTSSEDKRLGTHFVTKDDLKYEDTSGLTGKALIEAKLQNRRFPEKVIKYLWDDAFKFNREDVFDLGKYNCLESVIDKFVSSNGDDRFLIFLDNIRVDLLAPDNTDSKA